MFLLVFLALSAIPLFSQEISSPTYYRQQAFDVKRYEVIATVDLPSSKTIKGKCDIILEWTNDVIAPSFPINLRGLLIDSVVSHKTQLNVIEMGQVTTDTFHYSASISRNVTNGERDTITVYYAGKMTDEGGASAWGGVHYGDSVLYAIGVGFRNPSVSATQHWMPCYDHPSDKATLKLTMIVPSRFNVASNGLLTSTAVLNDTATAYEWEESHECATYLYTFAIARFKRMEFPPSNGIPVHVYSRPRDTAASAVSYKLVPRMTTELSRLYGPYPFDKVGYVNTTIGAMEHQTLVSFPISLVNLRDTVNTTAAHELAHQWFGDLVTPLDFRHAWLTESFATYTEAAWVEHLKGNEAYLTAIAASARNYITQVSRDEGVFALYDFPRASPSSNYPVTIYRKGQNILAMARALSGTEVFYETLKDYLDDHKYGTATTENMKEAFRPALGYITNAFFDEWVYGKGWPRIEVEITQNGPLHSVTLRQTQHTEFPEWPVFTTLPINVTYMDASTQQLVDTILVMTGAEFTFEIGSLDRFALNSGTRCRSLLEIVRTTSVDNESDTQLSCTLAPNPASDVAELTIIGSTSNSVLTVFNTTGKSVYSQPLNSETQHVSIPTTTLSSGNYTVVVVDISLNSGLKIPFSVLH